MKPPLFRFKRTRHEVTFVRLFGVAFEIDKIDGSWAWPELYRKGACFRDTRQSPPYGDIVLRGWAITFGVGAYWMIHSRDYDAEYTNYN